MTTYVLDFHKKWDEYFQKLDLSVKKRLFKKILKLQEPVPARHLKHGLPYFVLESKQYRICFTRNESKKLVKLFFAGTHKDYEKWIQKQ